MDNVSVRMGTFTQHRMVASCYSVCVVLCPFDRLNLCLILFLFLLVPVAAHFNFKKNPRHVVCASGREKKKSSTKKQHHKHTRILSSYTNLLLSHSGQPNHHYLSSSSVHCIFTRWVIVGSPPSPPSLFKTFEFAFNSATLATRI